MNSNIFKEEYKSDQDSHTVGNFTNEVVNQLQTQNNKSDVKNILNLKQPPYFNMVVSRRQSISVGRKSEDKYGDEGMKEYLNNIRQKQGTFGNHVQIYGLKKQFQNDLKSLKLTKGIQSLPISPRVAKSDIDK